MTHHLTPYRRRPAPTHPGFDPREIDVDMDICRWCGGLVPAAETQRVKHEDWEQRIANRFAQLLDRVAILEAATAQLSGQVASSGRESAAPSPARTPTSTSPPTPAQEATPAGRARVEGSNPQRTDRPGVVEPPPDATSPPGGPPTPPRRPSGGTKRDDQRAGR